MLISTIEFEKIYLIYFIFKHINY